MSRYSLARPFTVLGQQLLRSPDDLMDELRTLLKALADLEYRYETDCERLAQWSGPTVQKQNLLVERASRHRREREPVERKIDELQHRLRMQLTSDL